MNPHHTYQSSAKTHAGPADLDRVIADFETHAEQFLASRALPVNLLNAIRYSVLGGGKRLRPTLAWYSAVACGGRGEDSLNAGLAVELIHAFSLIHDDLPALDNDTLRRGRPTLHVHAGEAMAVLAGDALLSLAYEAALDDPRAEVSHQLCFELAQGTRAMIEGQVYDTIGGIPESLSDREAVELIHCNKTGALLLASCRMGAVAAGASTAAMDFLSGYASAIGLQFQVIDDLLDIEGDGTQVGKTLGKDAAAGKRTFPRVIGVAASRAFAEQLEQQAADALNRLEQLGLGDAQPLRALGKLLTHRQA